MASREVKPLPRSKPSGLPFHAHFVNVAEEAGLRAPIVYGGVDTKSYILETIGCGAAFLDYDNDGWLDIVLLTGRRLEDTPKEAIIRLYRNNRDGTFTDATEKSGLGRSVWACGITVGDYDNDGFDDLFITCWGQNILFHNNGDGTFTDVVRISARRYTRYFAELQANVFTSHQLPRAHRCSLECLRGIEIRSENAGQGITNCGLATDISTTVINA